jgi:hypothetical protein
MVLHSAKIVRRQRNTRWKKNFCLKVLFHGEQIFFLKQFLLVSNVKLWEIYDKKEK